MPSTAVPSRKPRGAMAALAGTQLPNDKPILLYMGGLGKEKPLHRIIDAVSLSKFSVFFIAFCNGSESDIKEIEAYANRKLQDGNFIIRSSVQREVLLSCAWEADIGVIDYSYSVEPTSNQKFCAPTKLYEYMAMGLAILGSNNESLRGEIVEKEGIGICAEDDSVMVLVNALNSLLDDPENLKEIKSRSETLYREKYCYEKLCKRELDKIVNNLN